MLNSVLGFLIAISVLVAVHEWGHFWVARRCGVKVLRFSIGFGPILWRRQDKQGTAFCLSAIPLGGYVKMLGEQGEDIPQGQEKMAFEKKSLAARSAIVAAGPLVNFLFAILALTVVFMVGMEVVRPITGLVTPGSAAAQAGIQEGDEILAMNGQPIENWEDFGLALLEVQGEATSIDLSVRQYRPSLVGKKASEVPVRVVRMILPEAFLIFGSGSQKRGEQPDIISLLGFSPVDLPIPAIVGNVSPGMPADRAGFQKGDKILSINGEPVTGVRPLMAYLKQYPEQKLDMLVERRGQQSHLLVTPEWQIREGERRPIIGIEFRGNPQEWKPYFRTQRLLPWSALVLATEKTGRYAGLTLKLMGRMVLGEISIKNLGGPITIAEQAGASVDIGWLYFLQFMAAISVSLGVLNLLPIPVLDGGHLFYYACEAVLGRPLSHKTREWGYRLGGFFVFFLITLALFNDLSRLFSSV